MAQRSRPDLPPRELVRALSPTEWSILESLWERGSATSLQTASDLAGSLDSRSVTLLLGRMVEKGAVALRRDGRENVYSPAIRRDAAVAAKVADFLDQVLLGQPQALEVLRREVDRRLGLPDTEQMPS